MGISYRHFLYGAICFISLLAAFTKVGVFRTSGSAPMEFFFGLFYFIFLVWSIGQLWLIRSREQAQQAGPAERGGKPISPPERPAEDVLASAELYLSLGESLETVCLFVNPKYQDWDSSQKLAFRQDLKAVLDERRKLEPGSAAS